ncbi:DNA-binding protein [Tenacibaculum piscium]|uniref:DNA-binding protein n=1 Tax=Tenacibaculum piscium TaxID=1458515 RepID=UPI001F22E2A7|nr:DNA-binding protein [Tenacibaculum piscium]
MTNIKERVLQITDFKRVAKEKFFSDLSISYANFKGKAKEKALSSDVLANIVTKYPEISSLWLLTGKGEMLVSEKAEKAEKSENTEIEIENKELKAENKELNKEVRELNRENRELNTEIRNLNNTIIELSTGQSKKVG